MWTPCRAITVNQRRLATTAGASGSLSVIRRCRGNVAHVNDVELSDINTQLHCWRAIENWKGAISKTLLPLLPHLVFNLGCVFTRFEPLKIGYCRAVKANEELVCSASLFRFIWSTNRI